MVDVLPAFAALLKDLAPVELAFPDKNAELPQITLTEIDNSNGLVLSGRERLSSVTVQVDVWDNSPTPERVIALATAANARIVGKGFSRISGQLMADGGFQRECMRFRGFVDGANGRVYSKI